MQRKGKCKRKGKVVDVIEQARKPTRVKLKRFHYITTKPQSRELAKWIKGYNVVSVDLKGIDVSYKGRITYVIIGWHYYIACLDIIKLGHVPPWVKKVIECQDVTKVCHDCRADSENLFHEYGIQLRNVFDTTVANLLERRLSQNPTVRFCQLGDIVKKKMKRLPTFLFYSDRVDVTDFKAKMKTIWSSLGRESVWGRSPLSDFEQKYATLNCLLALELYNLYIREWNGQEKYLSLIKEVTMHYFVNAYRRPEIWTGRVSRKVVGTIDKKLGEVKSIMDLKVSKSETKRSSPHKLNVLDCS